CVPIETGFHTPLQSMAAGGPGEVQLRLKEIAEGGHDGASRRVEGLEEAVAEFQRGIGVVWSWEGGGGSGDAERCRPEVLWRNGAGIGEDYVALAVHVLHAEGGVEEGLVGIGGWAGHVVIRKPAEKPALCAQLLVEADGKMVGIRVH